MKAALALLLVGCAAPAAVPASVPPPSPATPEPPEVAPSSAGDAPTPEPGPSMPAPAVSDVPPAKPVARLPADTRSCAARGGKLQPVCMGGVVECVIRYRDAGKRCSDKKDCTGDCLFVGKDAPPRGTPGTGKCQTTSDSCGCAARVVGGHVQGVDCLD